MGHAACATGSTDGPPADVGRLRDVRFLRPARCRHSVGTRLRPRRRSPRRAAGGHSDGAYWRRVFDGARMQSAAPSRQRKGCDDRRRRQPGFPAWISAGPSISTCPPHHRRRRRRPDQSFRGVRPSELADSGTQIVARLRIDTSPSRRWLARPVDPAGAAEPRGPSTNSRRSIAQQSPCAPAQGMAQFARLLGTKWRFSSSSAAAPSARCCLWDRGMREEAGRAHRAARVTRTPRTRHRARRRASLRRSARPSALPIARRLFKGIAAFQLSCRHRHRTVPSRRRRRALAAVRLLHCSWRSSRSLDGRDVRTTADAAEKPAILRRRHDADDMMSHPRRAGDAQVAAAMAPVAGAGLPRAASTRHSTRTRASTWTRHHGEIRLRHTETTSSARAAFFKDSKARLHATLSLRLSGRRCYRRAWAARLPSTVCLASSPTVWFSPVDDGYLTTMRLRLKGGRDFTSAD